VPGLLLRHDSSQAHDTGPHPERIARIVAIERALTEAGWLGMEVADSPDVPGDALSAVHPDAYVSAIEASCAAGGGALDPDTFVSEGSYVAARHAAGGAVALVDALCAREVPFGASLHRPPGHHAEPARAMGFCLFNNIAIAARHAIAGHGLERVLILDWDVHHGNGTNDIFHADPGVLFVSIHQSPLYPGTGAASDFGSGPGTGLTVNIPVPAGSGDALYRSLVEHVVAPAARAWRPQLVLVSAGFDAHADDPLAGCMVSAAGFAAMAAVVRDLGAELEAPVGVVLEGGYDLDALTTSLLATLETFMQAPDGGGDPPPASDAVAAVARRVAERLPAPMTAPGG
jgi:acetoin utilization deacetylase AcuC-like enzyme